MLTVDGIRAVVNKKLLRKPPRGIDRVVVTLEKEPQGMIYPRPPDYCTIHVEVLRRFAEWDERISEEDTREFLSLILTSLREKYPKQAEKWDWRPYEIPLNREKSELEVWYTLDLGMMTPDFPLGKSRVLLFSFDKEDHPFVLDLLELQRVVSLETRNISQGNLARISTIEITLGYTGSFTGDPVINFVVTGDNEDAVRDIMSTLTFNLRWKVQRLVRKTLQTAVGGRMGEKTIKWWSHMLMPQVRIKQGQVGEMLYFHESGKKK